MRLCRLGPAIAISGLLALAAAAHVQPQSRREKQKQLAQEAAGEAYYKKWLNEDVVHIIADEERQVFEKLSGDEEREAFIEQFWLRRDPDLSTATNEFKEEHYRRLQYANENFYSGKAGWMTDRGRIYVRFGPPDSRQRFSSGETYVRPFSQGGGITKTFPFEIWRYRLIEGIGPDVEIEFVDPSNTGEFRISIDPVEKDILFKVGTGPTEYEEMGRESRFQRDIRRGLATNYPGPVKDLPFERMARLAVLDRPPQIRYDDLKSIVTTNISYNQLPSTFHTYYIRLNPEKALVWVTITIPNSALSYENTSQVWRADLQIYGIIQDLGGRILTEFEESLAIQIPPHKQDQEMRAQSVFQKSFLLEPGSYKLSLVARNPQSKQMVTRVDRIFVPAFAQGLWSSPVLAADRIELLPAGSDPTQPFVIGDLQVLPRLNLRYKVGEEIKLYWQVYNAQVDATTQKPAVAVRYFFRKDGKLARHLRDDSGSSLYYFSDQRLVFLSAFPISDLEPGSYELLIRTIDQVSQQEASATLKLTIEG